MAPSMFSPSSFMRARRYVASIATSEAAMISAEPHDESATVGCFLLLHVMAALPYKKTCPEVECRVPQSDSEKPVRGKLSVRAYRNPTDLWCDR
eukprot:2264821-Pleurochrysis_carterae.AAC.2